MSSAVEVRHRLQDAERIQALLGMLYDNSDTAWALEHIGALLESFPVRPRRRASLFSEKDVVLITYADSLRRSGEAPLRTLHRFANRYFGEILSTIHLLPFFPYSSDDGFSVIDYYRVHPDVGSWEDVEFLCGDFDLMFDLVLNHLSSRSPWFQNYLAGREGFERLAIEADPKADLSSVIRPRALPLLTRYRKSSGESVHLWTTFSADQIDLNFADPGVLLRMIEVLLFYVRKGARIVRLDAIAYLWKTVGTSCVHLPRTHTVVQLFRELLNRIAPETILLTETNVPHAENISYLGDGHNEAQMVYNFTLPPLTLYSLIREDATRLTEWAEGVSLPSPETTFFNFTASHDGIGVRPLEGILSQAEWEHVLRRVKANGGRVSYKQNADGSQSPYELNISYIDALARAEEGGEGALLVSRFLASQAIALSLPGIPAVYIHSLLGSRNWTEGVEITGRARSINREKLDADRVKADLACATSFRRRIYAPYRALIELRRKQPAFHPNASYRVLRLHPKVFAILREGGGQRLASLTSLSSQPLDLPAECFEGWNDLIEAGRRVSGSLSFAPCQVRWLSTRKV